MGRPEEPAGGLGRDLIPLGAIGAADRAEVGGKALELGHLAREGLPVPAGAVIPVRTFRQALERHGLLALAEAVRDDAARAPELRAAIASLALPESWRADWIATARRLGPRLAVRSSGVDEDGVERSFAGQHETLLEVPPEGVPAAVLRCWASLYADRALAYRGGAGPEPGALAVLVQQMVEPSCSGVMFTINPLNGSWREMVVEAVWGLGEGLVSGQIAPHYYLVRRPRRLPRGLRRVAERVRLHVVEEDLPELPERFVGGPRGTVVREPNPRSLRWRRTLDRPALRRLCRLGLQVERILGAPMDVEWVRDQSGSFRVLQARPITRTGTPRGMGEVLWTRRFIGERWPEPATPLGWSILEPLLSWFIAYPETQERLLGGGPALKLVRGRPYINATVFRHLAFKLPGSPPPRFMLELVPPEEERAWRQRFAVAPDFAVYGSIFRKTFEERRWERFRWNPFTNHLEWDRFEARLATELPVLCRVPDDPEQAVDLVRAQIEAVREYIGIHICSLLFANIWWQLLEGAIASWLPEHRALMEGLATCPPGNRTVETNQALHALAATVSDEDLEVLARGELPDGPSGEALRDFLARFGHRSEASWELMSPRWGRQPERLGPLLRAQRATRGASPEARAHAQEERHRVALAELRAAASGSRLTILEMLVHYTRRYLLLRENQRFWFDQLLDAMQGTLLAIGAHGVRAGWLERADDVAHLTWSEVQGLVAGMPTDGVLARVAQRRDQRAADAASLPPTFLTGDLDEAPEPGAGRLQGLGISPGRVRGRVRVIRALSEGPNLQPGEILVTHAVDPGWTPLFLTAGAVVLEMGSVLSHGAVVAREYDVPAVVNIDDATRRLVDGQEVTVDGHRGVVWVHGDPP